VDIGTSLVEVVLHVVIEPLGYVAESPDLGAPPLPRVEFDIRLRFDVDASTTELLAVLIERAQTFYPEAILQISTVGLALSLGQAFGEERLLGLPLDAQLIGLGLRSGDRLLVIAKSRIEQFAEPVRLDGISDDELVLVDDISPFRGRVTVVPLTGVLTVGNMPDSSPRLILNNSAFPPSLMTIESSGSGRALITIDQKHRYEIQISGTKGARELYVGSRLKLGESFSFIATTKDAVLDRNPIGKVRYDAPARPAREHYPRHSSSLDSSPTEPEFDWHQLLEGFIGPVALGLIMYAVSRKPYFLFFVGVQPIVSFGLFRLRRRRGLQKFAEDKAKWETARLDQLKQFKIDIALERKLRNDEALPLNQLLEELHGRSGALWARTSGDPDFLVVKIGKGELESAMRPDIQQIDRGDQADLNTTLKQFSKMQDVAVTVDLRQHGIAIVGSVERTLPLILHVLLQIFIQRSPSEVGVGALLPAAEDLSDDFDWFKWLPHFQSASGVLPARPIAIGRRNSDALLRFILTTLDNNSSQRSAAAAPPQADTILLVHEGSEVDRELLETTIERSAGRIRLIWLGFGREAVPASADLIFEVGDNWIVTVEDRHNHFEEFKTFLATKELSDGRQIDRTLATDAALRLSALYDPAAIGKSAGLPSEIALSALLRPEALPALELRDQLDTSSPLGFATDERLISTFGVTDRGPMQIDLAKDGPHCLVGGTTGSGKSELLQSMLVGFVANHPPSELGLLLVDFKGGAAFDIFKDCPNVLGFVRDLDGDNVTRMLAFLRREIRRREEMFQEDLARGWPTAKSYAEYRSTRGEKFDVPRLLVAVDEFATLVDVSPEFMKGVIDVAQRGRSLGIHMILATQQPSGDVIDSKVRANVGIRIALRTADTSNSELIMDAPDAALISRSTPGRAFMRAGSDPLIELQAAFGGSNQHHARLKGGVQKTVSVESFTLRDESFEPRSERAEIVRKKEDGPTDLELVLERLRMQWPGDSPRLGDRLGQPELLTVDIAGARAKGDARYAIGLVDQPSAQRQIMATPNLSAGAFLVTGGLTSGKSWTLSSVASRFLEEREESRDGFVILIDSSGGGLTEAAERFGLLRNQAPVHDGIVLIDGRDLEKVTRVLDRLDSMADIQSEPDSDGHRATTLLVIDDIGALMNGLSSGAGRPWIPVLSRILTIGRKSGQYCALSSDTIQNVPYEYRGTVRWNYQLGTTNGEARSPEIGPGIGYFQGFGMMQILSDSYSEVKQWGVPQLARVLRGEPLDQNALALDDVLNDPVPLAEAGGVSLLVVGRSGSGKSTVLRRIAIQARSAQRSPWVLCGRPMRKSDEWRDWPDFVDVGELQQLGKSVIEHYDRADEYTAAFAERLSAGATTHEIPLLIADDAHYFKNDNLMRTAIDALVRLGACQVVLASDLLTAQYDGWRAITEAGDVLILQPGQQLAGQDEGELVASKALLQRPNARYGVCEGILISGNQQRRVRISRNPMAIPTGSPINLPLPVGGATVLRTSPTPI
jgi:FtsK/SpoIIIE family